MADIYFNNGNNFELSISLALSVIVFIIGHIIVLYNQHLNFNKRIYILKCVYAIMVLYVCVLLSSDVIEIWANMFINGIHLNELHVKNENLLYSFILCFLILASLLLLKNLQFTLSQDTKQGNNYE